MKTRFLFLGGKVNRVHIRVVVNVVAFVVVVVVRAVSLQNHNNNSFANIQVKEIIF